MRWSGSCTWRCTPTRRGNASWKAIAGFGATVLIGMALLLIGSFFHGGVRVALWAAALAIDYAGPAWPTRERLRGLQRVAVAHFAERYGLFVIICLGESIVAIGVAGNVSRGHLGAEPDHRRDAHAGDHDRDVVDLLRPVRGHSRGASARARGPGARRRRRLQLPAPADRRRNHHVRGRRARAGRARRASAGRGAAAGPVRRRGAVPDRPRRVPVAPGGNARAREGGGRRRAAGRVRRRRRHRRVGAGGDRGRADGGAVRGRDRRR